MPANRPPPDGSRHDIGIGNHEGDVTEQPQGESPREAVDGAIDTRAPPV